MEEGSSNMLGRRGAVGEDALAPYTFVGGSKRFTLRDGLKCFFI